MVVRILVFLVLLICSLAKGDEHCERTKCGAQETATLVDPRLNYRVNMTGWESVDLTDVPQMVEEIASGKGYVIIPQMFSREDIAHARSTIHYLIKTQGKKATHFQGSENSRPELQARTWDLLNKGQIFEKMAQHPKFLAIIEKFLGDDCVLGSIAGNTLFPGASGQEPHIDYPYWDYYKRSHWPVPPKVEHIPFHMNMQVTVFLDDFTEENGATAAIPGTQVRAEYPKADEFYRKCIQVTGKAGDVMIFPGLLQHCAMPNKSNKSRTGLLNQYLPKFVRPCEDIKGALLPEVRSRLTPRLRKLIAMDYPYPALLDEAKPISTEGYSTDFDWK